MRVDDRLTMYLLQPTNHNPLPDSPSFENMASVSKLYFGFTEQLSRCIEKSKFDYEECYIFGFCFFACGGGWISRQPKQSSW
jgi:hypothetical protein